MAPSCLSCAVLMVVVVRVGVRVGRSKSSELRLSRPPTVRVGVAGAVRVGHRTWYAARIVACGDQGTRVLSRVGVGDPGGRQLEPGTRVLSRVGVVGAVVARRGRGFEGHSGLTSSEP